MNQYLEKIAALNLVHKNWVEGALKQMSSVGRDKLPALTAANSKAKALLGKGIHPDLHSGEELAAFRQGPLMSSALNAGKGRALPADAARASALATGIQARRLKYGNKGI